MTLPFLRQQLSVLFKPCQGSRPIATSFELVLSSCPIKRSSKFPQNFKQFMILDKLSVFVAWLLCFSNKCLYPESISAAMECSPYQEMKGLLICLPVSSCFKLFSFKCFKSVTPFDAQV